MVRNRIAFLVVITGIAGTVACGGRTALDELPAADSTNPLPHALDAGRDGGDEDVPRRADIVPVDGPTDQRPVVEPARPEAGSDTRRDASDSAIDRAPDRIGDVPLPSVDASVDLRFDGAQDRPAERATQLDTRDAPREAGSDGNPGDSDGPRRMDAGQPVLSLLAGGLGNAGILDGVGTAARFSDPNGMVSDGAATLFVADTGNHTIRKVVLATLKVTTLAGLAGSPGDSDGSGQNARFRAPVALVYDGAGTLFVADKEARAIRRVTVATGMVETLSLSGVALAEPTGLAMDGGTRLFVADSGLDCILTIDLTSGVVSHFAGLPGGGSDDGVGLAVRFRDPRCLTNDGQGHLYVSDTGNHTIRRIDLATVKVTTVAGTAGIPGSDDGIGDAARFYYPWDLLCDANAGALYVSDSANGTIRKILLSTREVSTVHFTDGPGGYVYLGRPAGLVLNGASALLIADSGTSTVRQIALATLTASNLLGSAMKVGFTDGTGEDARFWNPTGVALDGLGNVFVADQANSIIRKIVSSTGAVSTLAGKPVQRGSSDGAGSAALFNQPWGVTMGDPDRLFVTDAGNHTIRQITVTTGAVVTVAGSPGVSGSADGIGSAARFNSPSEMVYDGNGNLYVADTLNHTIRKVAIATATVSTVAGKPGVSGEADGIGSEALFFGPAGLASDGSGHLIIADTYGHSIRKLAIATGEVTTVAGGNVGSTDGIGLSASFTVPQGLASRGGILYIADSQNNTVRRMDLRTQEVSTVVGGAGRRGVLLGPLPGQLLEPVGLAIMANGDLVIVERQENSVLIARF